MQKEDLTRILEEIAILLEIKGENPFKTRAYQKAAHNILNYEGSLDKLISSGDLEKIEGIGEAISKKIFEFYDTGTIKYYEDLKKEIPEGLLELLKVPSLGPKKIKTLYDKLQILTVGELEYAAKEHRLRTLDGFGEKTEEKILEGIEFLKKFHESHLYSEALTVATEIFNYLKESKLFLNIEIAGSIRRKKETVKDIDLVSSSEYPEKAAKLFIENPKTAEAIATGETKTSIKTKDGINVDLRVVKREEFPFALHHFTGSKEHNTLLRSLAKDRETKINEYGIFKGDILIPCKNEREIFEKFGLQFIPPELREGLDEIEKAKNKEIPELVEEKDLKGLFHIHSSYSDGTLIIKEIASLAKSLSFEYIGISDHSQTAYYANGLKEDDLKRQWDEIDKFNEESKNFRIFKGIESDILPDGSLDYRESILEKFDFVIASVHSKFKMSEEEMTQRIKRAIENPHTTMIGHLTGRLLLSREGYKVNVDEILETASKNNVIMELNSNPFRLDLDWRNIKSALKMKILISINPDMHDKEGINDYKYGIGIARKGWATKKDILNTLSLTDVSLFLKNLKQQKRKQ